MNLFISDAIAQTATSSATGGSPFSLFFMVAVIVLMYFMLIRPQQKRMKEQQNMLGRLAVGDEVVTSGGLLGKIVEVSDAIVTLEIADGVQVKVQKPQITGLVPKGTLKKG
ncbi:MAG: preprotein translocase subunit YajC [Steroidobacteraceae bacterium]